MSMQMPSRDNPDNHIEPNASTFAATSGSYVPPMEGFGTPAGPEFAFPASNEPDGMSHPNTYDASPVVTAPIAAGGSGIVANRPDRRRYRSAAWMFALSSIALSGVISAGIAGHYDGLAQPHESSAAAHAADERDYRATAAEPAYAPEAREEASRLADQEALLKEADLRQAALPRAVEEAQTEALKVSYGAGSVALAGLLVSLGGDRRRTRRASEVERD